MRKACFSHLITLTAVLPLCAFATGRDANNSVIQQMTIGTTTGDLLFIKVNPAPAATGNCHSNPSWHYVLDLSTLTGQHMYALILAADAADHALSFAGLDSCSLSSGIETLRAVGKTNG